MEIRILLIVRNRELRKVYSEAVRALGVRVTAVPSLTGLNPEVTRFLFHGVAIDMPTKMNAVKEDKELTYAMLRKFPVIHLSLEKGKQQTKVYYPGQAPGATLADFVNERCRPFTPRRLAHHIRKEIHFNVLLSKELNLRQRNFEQTFTVDVSEGGCFVFSAQDWKRGDLVWLTLNELTDRTPILAQVRRRVKWGTAFQLPGIGLKFEKIKVLQMKEIASKLWA